MRRSVLSILAAVAISVIATANLTTAAGPYVYGCTPLTFPSTGGSWNGDVSIYNGGATTANLTHKILAGDGTILNTGLSVATTSTLGATKTETLSFTVDESSGSPGVGNSTLPASVRVVSDIPVAVGVVVNGLVGQPLTCTRLSPE
jgi:hypothetical protein